MHSSLRNTCHVRITYNVHVSSAHKCHSDDKCCNVTATNVLIDDKRHIIDDKRHPIDDKRHPIEDKGHPIDDKRCTIGDKLPQLINCNDIIL